MTTDPPSAATVDVDRLVADLDVVLRFLRASADRMEACAERWRDEPGLAHQHMTRRDDYQFVERMLRDALHRAGMQS